MPDTRLLVDLTSHAGDLSEASHALGCALSAGEGSELWMPLTSHAVTAYFRPFILSNVRTRLDEMPGFPPMPAALQSVHETVRKYRNATIAHSQSNLSMPLPLAFLDAQGQGVDVMGLSIIHPMPLAVAESFTDLIAAVEDVVEMTTQPVLERLRTWVKDQSPETISGWGFPDFFTLQTRISRRRIEEVERLVLLPTGGLDRRAVKIEELPTNTCDVAGLTCAGLLKPSWNAYFGRKEYGEARRWGTGQGSTRALFPG